MKDYFLDQAGERIRKRRKQMNFTQSELAEKTGLTSQTIASAEYGKKELRIENFANICQALEVSADYLLFGGNAPLNQSLFTEKASHLPLEQRRCLDNIINSFIAALEAGEESKKEAEDRDHSLWKRQKRF